jgi:hypothetical protein
MESDPSFATGEHETVCLLSARLVELSRSVRFLERDPRLDQVLDDIEAVCLAVAGTRSLSLVECLLKSEMLRERLVEMLDVGVPSEAVTLALAGSVTLDLKRFAT